MVEQVLEHNDFTGEDKNQGTSPVVKEYDLTFEEAAKAAAEREQEAQAILNAIAEFKRMAKSSARRETHHHRNYRHRANAP